MTAVKIDRLRFRGAVSEFGQARLAEAIGTKQPNISRMFKNLDGLTFERFNRICQVMGFEPQEFILFTKDAPESEDGHKKAA